MRTVLKRCLNLDSYADEPVHVESPFRSDNSLIGHLETPGSWGDFYESAAASPRLFLVKTHLPPRDSAPYIYVVRDGRSVVTSYKSYYEHYVPGHRPSLFQLIAGDDAYGDWSSHYKAWTERPQPRGMVIRFEDLADVSEEKLKSVAAFLGHKSPTMPWRNPMETLAQAEPGFFRSGSKTFERDEAWTDLVDQFFNYCHGELMGRLGYALLDTGRASADHIALFDWCRRLLRRSAELAGVCDERLALINQISSEAERRLELINSLSGQRQAS